MGKRGVCPLLGQQKEGASMNEKEILKRSIADHQKAIDKAKSELSALDKPKLKKGDIWEGAGKRLCIYVKEYNCDHRDCVVLDNGNVITNIGHYYKGEPIITNLKIIFDDLKAMSEDLTEFEIKDKDGTHIKCDWFGNKRLRVFQTNVTEREEDCISIIKEQLPEFILNLRRLIATAKRKQQDA